MSIQPAAVLAALHADRAVSGSELALRLGVTRAGVWKQMQSLRALGVPIRAVPGQGYCLTWPFEPLDAYAIRAALAARVRRRLGGLHVHWQVDSTSSELLRAAAAGAPDLSVCLAETQTEGRGRRGRKWVSPLGANVYLSVLKRLDCSMGELSGLSLAAGVAVREALSTCGAVGIGLKWPNDVVVGGGKLAGILVEAGGEFLGPCFAVIGIGVNLRLPETVATGQPAVDLAHLCGDALPPRNVLVAQLLARLVAALDDFAAAGFAAFAASYAAYDTLAGRAVRVHAANGVRDGIADGVDARGALRMRHGNDVAIYDSADVSVRSGLAGHQ